MIQLQLFDIEHEHNGDDAELRHLRSEVSILTQRLNEVKLSNDKVRKGLFARHGELAKMYLELHMRQAIIEENICKGKF